MTNPLSSKPLKAVSVPSGSSPDWVAVELVKEFDDNSGPPSGARFEIRGLFIVTAVFSFQFALVSYLGGWAGVMLSPLIAVCMIGVAAIGEIVWGRRGGHQIAPSPSFWTCWMRTVEDPRLSRLRGEATRSRWMVRRNRRWPFLSRIGLRVGGMVVSRYDER